MTDANKEQPAPKPSDKKPSWEIVIGYAEAVFPLEEDETARLVVADMRERDQIGRERYGVPLTAGNGRNSLIDAYQERLDGVVYLATWLYEQGVDVEKMFSTFRADQAVDTSVVPPHAERIFGLFINDVAMLGLLRAEISALAS
jgi:hypothetical protein